MSNKHQKDEMRELIKRHQESVKKQDELYQKNLTSKFRRPSGAGLDEDDLSKVSSTDVIGKGEDSDLRK